MDTGFNYYHGADPSEYDLVVSNSEGGHRPAARARRAPRRGRLLGRRPRVLRAAAGREGARTSSSTATATSSGASGWRRSSASRAAPRPRDRLRARRARLPGRHREARAIGDVPFNVFARAISAARVNLNITRRSHATVHGSSTCRPFELASAGAAIVSNPHAGIERWFEPGSEIIVVDDAEAGARRLPRAARRPGRGGGDGRAGARASARRAHLRAPRTPGARAARARGGGQRRDPGARRRDRPGPQRGGVRSAASSPEIKALRPGDRRRRGRRRLDRTGPRRRRGRGGCHRRPPAVQPRHRRGRPDRVPLRARARLRAGRAARRRRPARPAELPKLLAALERGEADVVTGSRFADGDDGYRPPLAPAARDHLVRAARLAAHAASG